MPDEAILVDVTVQTPEPSSETPLQETPKTMEFLMGQAMEKISAMEIQHQNMNQMIVTLAEEIKTCREMDRMTSEEVYRIANELFSQVQEIQEQVQEVEEEQDLEEQDLQSTTPDEIPILPDQTSQASEIQEQDKPKASKRRPWFL